MDKADFGKHISQQFNEELEDIRTRVLTMAGVVEQQLADALTALESSDNELADEVIKSGRPVNEMEKSIDEDCAQCIARRQPTASDLRMVVSIIKAIVDIERIGDQAERVAHIATKLNDEQQRPKNNYQEIVTLGEEVKQMVHNAFDAFARIDDEAALAVIKHDKVINNHHETIMRQHMTYMMEDPRNIGRSMEVLWAVRALERIGDHATNIAEYVIYLACGEDVRHTSLKAKEKIVED